MATTASQIEVRAAVEAAARDLVTLRSVGDTNFLNLPLIYPDGASVTVKIDPIAGGVRVSDGGFAYRELEDLGAESSFGQAVQKISETIGVQTTRRTIYTDAPVDSLFRAICDVAIASWQVTETVYRRILDREEADIEDHLRGRLQALFGEKLRAEHKVKGASSSEWDVSAIVSVNGKQAIFQAVGTHANSIYKATAAFHDLSLLENAPILVAVVRDKVTLGSRLGLLSQVGRVIEEHQPDATFQRAVK